MPHPWQILPRVGFLVVLSSKLQPGPEELRLLGRELYVFFPNGSGRSKLPPLLDRTLKSPATARNWSSVLKLFEIAEDLESTIF